MAKAKKTTKTQMRSILQKSFKKRFPFILFCDVKFQFHFNQILKFELCMFNTFSDVNV